MNTNSKRIAITGPFADVNFGDYAMLINNIYDLDIKDITLFSYDNDFLRTIREDYLNDYNVNIVEVKLKNENSNCIKDEYTLMPIEILSMISNYDELREKIEDIDVLIVNGGGYFNGLWSMPHRIVRLIKIISPILVANQLNKKIMFTGNSYGPFAKDSEFFATLFNALSNVTFGCRDNLYSPMWARQVGVKDIGIKNIPDDLFLINDRILAQQITTSVKSKDYIVMETYLPLDFIKENINYFKDFSNKIFERYGLEIVFLPLNLEHGGMQQGVYLNEVLDNYEYVDITKKGYLPIQDAVEIIRNAKLVVSSRYHALVVALGTETPTISVLKDVMGDKRYYYNKNCGMLRHALNGTDFDERFYLRLDYLETLDFITENFNEIVEEQKKNYNSRYISNIEFLKAVRKEYLNEIIN
ncbi:polysaccharide pyruvyl transferase family protein [Alteribacillus iranensis]|uniref:Polysaccharide pyruvyl transferase n=1 Tax=Alteribacillus iranensis TaxID=930128 RepID=A0A1I2BH09_9BACI|nr:polysaccharide pyruvyl transferase family protein [Alteribacillus iranensis]SFE55461.1 Polysaccharide pyruvyl transferase [Alteribacillus iranensis]